MGDDEEQDTPSDTEWAAYWFIAGVVFIVVTVAYLIWET